MDFLKRRRRKRRRKRRERRRTRKEGGGRERRRAYPRHPSITAGAQILNCRSAALQDCDHSEGQVLLSLFLCSFSPNSDLPDARLGRLDCPRLLPPFLRCQHPVDVSLLLAPQVRYARPTLDHLLSTFVEAAHVNLGLDMALALVLQSLHRLHHHWSSAAQGPYG